MKYYKVKKQFDQKRVNNGKSFLIADELYTPSEIKKITGIDIDKMFDVVEVSKKQTYCGFGARFAN